MASCPGLPYLSKLPNPNRCLYKLPNPNGYLSKLSNPSGYFSKLPNPNEDLSRLGRQSVKKWGENNEFLETIRKFHSQND